MQTSITTITENECEHVRGWGQGKGQGWGWGQRQRQGQALGLEMCLNLSQAPGYFFFCSFFVLSFFITNVTYF